jgi:hypothetical protein
MPDLKTKQSPTPTTSTNDVDVASGGTMAGVGAQGHAHAMQGGMGNSAAQSMVSGQTQTWRGIGNLQGNPPVRSEKPPNIGIEEYESVYRSRRAATSAQFGRQKATADRFLGEATSPLDARYWFAKVYSYVTEGELEDSAAGAFYYPSYVMQCVRYFDQIYQDNVKAADTGGNVEEHWKRAFEVCADEDGYVGPDILDFLTGDLYKAVRSLVISMQAHIRYDLPRAEAWVFQSYYGHMAGASMGDFEPDFMSMMDVFERAAAKMNTEIADLHHLPADMMPRSMQDLAMSSWFDADMATERAVTWERAQELGPQGLVGTDPYTEGPGGALRGDVTSSDNLSNIKSIGGNAEAPYLERGFIQAAAETVGLDGSLSWNPMNWTADTAVRSDVSGSTPQQLQAMGPSQRAQMMRRCASGWTFNGDEDTILTLIQASIDAGEVGSTIDAAVAYDLLAATHGAQYVKMRQMFIDHYYPFMALPVAMAYLKHCMVGSTGEWHEEMIVDILVAKKFVNSQGEVDPNLPLVQSEAHALIGMIGLEFEGGGYDGGLIELEEQLDFGDEDRMHQHFGRPTQNTAGDTRIRQQTNAGNVAQMPLSRRISMVKRLIQGATTNADEDAIIKILQGSKRSGDLVPLIDAVGAHVIAADIHGSQWGTVKSLFRQSYYTRTSQAKAFYLLNTCIVGSTDEWEQEMIADLVCLRSDGQKLIERLGGGAGLSEGLNVLEWNLDGYDETRVTNQYGSSGKWW